MDITMLWMTVGFLFAAYSVVANDSVQTLGTWIASNSQKFKWYWLWVAASSVLLFTLWYGWSVNDGDISFGRLNKIPWIETQWYHALAPLILLALTRVGIPVSTTFLVLSAFASTFILEKMLVKSIMGYAIAAVVAYVLWFGIERLIDEKADKVREKNIKYWRIGQWCTTGFLWYTWLSHDLANIAVFLPRSVPVEWMLAASGIFIVFLGYMFYEKGGRIQKIVLEKTGTRYVRSATIIDLVYAFILLFFKQYNDIPMSTTWVFVGLLCGRELAISTIMKDYKFKYVFPIIAKDFIKMLVGLLVSIGIVLIIHYVIVPNGL
jgi:phosphate/sulfate permease